MSSHTPGPWFVSNNGDYVRKSDGPNWPAWNICEMNTHTNAAEANARLIAAAPELLAALTALLDSQKGLDLAEWQAAVAAGHAAIAKAKGQGQRRITCRSHH